MLPRRSDISRSAAEPRPGKPLWRLRAEICGPVVFERAREIEGYVARVEAAPWTGAKPIRPHPLPLSPEAGREWWPEGGARLRKG